MDQQQDIGGSKWYYSAYEGIHKLRVQDGEEAFFPAQLAEYWFRLRP